MPIYPTDLDIYISDAGDDSNSGSASSPLRSPTAAFALAEATRWTRSARVIVQGDDYDWTAPVGGGTNLYVPRGLPGARPLLLVGGLQDDPGFPAVNVTSSSAGSNGVPPATFARLGFASAPEYAGGQAVGSFVEGVAGPYVGAPQVVSASDATSVEVANAGASPGTGTMRVRRPRARIESGGFDLRIVGGELLVVGFDLLISGAGRLVLAGGARVLLSASRVGARAVVGAGSTLVMGNAQNARRLDAADADMLTEALALYNATAAGCYVYDVEVGAGGVAAAERTVVGALLSNAGAVEAHEVAAQGVGPFVAGGGSLWVTESIARATIYVRGGASANLNNVVCSHGGEAGVVVSDALASLTNVRGSITFPGAHGVVAHGAARVAVLDPNTGTQVTGPSGRAVQLGGLGTKTWTQIAAGAPANVLDLTSAGAAATSVSFG